ncbi:MAG: cofactor assembly of complex C subunit B [Cyanobacteria bacterium SID2]|nr:cofactor assembly of complex C subunit B [Cyanobacteria bacterium SID2]
MTNSMTTSIAIPTLLMAVGLIFFIRAASKDRTEEARWSVDRSPEDLSSQLKQYFTERGYRPVAFDAQENRVTFEGRVRASGFLAVFLSILAAIGLLCVALVFSTLVPQLSNASVSIVALSPLAGWFYWKTASRIERVSTIVNAAPNGNLAERSFVTVSSHRDEIAALKQALPERSSTELLQED